MRGKAPIIPKKKTIMNQHQDTSKETRYITEVIIERFKAAFKPRPIPLKPFNVIIGRNGSGKSTLIEALQWLDTTIRRDAREVSDRYFGLHDLINLRSRTKVPYFQLTLRWSERDTNPPVHYRVKVEEEKNGNPFIAEEELITLQASGGTEHTYVRTESRGNRVILPEAKGWEMPIQEPDRLSLALAVSAGSYASSSPIGFLQSFWPRAVFLRLSPNRLAHGSPATRKSFEPLLDEEGQTLPALLNELTQEQREELVSCIQGIMPDIRNVEVLKAELGRDSRVHYSLLERMPFRGRSGRSQFPIPSWMLSEGTRRITAILALLIHDPPPSLLCIEEIENGLDPWTVISVLKHLQSAADRGTQVVLTTHSPWLLDHVELNTILHVRRDEGDTKYEQFSSRPEIQGFFPSIPPGTRYVSEG
jgi:predicted ATPase